MNKRGFGSLGEKLAEDYLIQNGFKILERNYRVGRIGEIDIIATENDYICFIEVKTRTGSLYGLPIEAVGHTKRKKIKELALIYLKQKRMIDKNIRFDIVEVMGNRTGDKFEMEKINIVSSAF